MCGKKKTCFYASTLVNGYLYHCGQIYLPEEFCVSCGCCMRTINRRQRTCVPGWYMYLHECKRNIISFAHSSSSVLETWRFGKKSTRIPVEIHHPRFLLSLLCWVTLQRTSRSSSFPFWRVPYRIPQVSETQKKNSQPSFTSYKSSKCMTPLFLNPLRSFLSKILRICS